MDVEPLHTKIEKSIETFLGTILLENPAGFPWDESNLYMLSPDGKIRWMAEKPDARTLFSRVTLNKDGETFSAYTLGGHACDLELRTGKLIGYTTLK
jgi:hypothetical protein